MYSTRCNLCRLSPRLTMFIFFLYLCLSFASPPISHSLSRSLFLSFFLVNCILIFVASTSMYQINSWLYNFLDTSEIQSSSESEGQPIVGILAPSVTQPEHKVLTAAQLTPNNKTPHWNV